MSTEKGSKVVSLIKSSLKLVWIKLVARLLNPTPCPLVHLSVPWKATSSFLGKKTSDASHTVSMFAKMAKNAHATHRFQPLQPSLELNKSVDQKKNKIKQTGKQKLVALK